MTWGVVATVAVKAVQSNQQKQAAIKAGDRQAAAARAAGQTELEATKLGIEEQRRQFDVTRRQAEPFRQAGLGALEQQQALLGLSGQEAQQQALAGFQESPGQQFIRQRQERALLRNQAAIGGLGGGNVRAALQQQAAGFAQQDFQNQLSRLGGIAGQGQVATSNIAQLGAGAAGNISNLLQAGGQAQAGGILGAGQAQAAGQLGGAAAQSRFLGQLGSAFSGGAQGAQTEGVGFQQGFTSGLVSDGRLKRDVSDLDTKDCYDAVMSMDLKAWKYLEGIGLNQDQHFGTMAEDSPDMIRLGEINGVEMLSLHDELIMIAGAIQYMREKSWH